MTTASLNSSKLEQIILNQDDFSEIDFKANKELLTTPLPSQELPLNFAILNKSLSFAQRLLEENVNPFLKNQKGFSAFDQAVFLKDKQTINFLFKSDLQEINPPTHCQKAYSEIKYVIENSSDIAIKNGLISSIILSENVEILKSYLSNSPYIFDLHPKMSLSTLHFASVGNNTDMIDLLVQHGFSINSKDDKGQTPLHYAALKENKESFFVLLKHGAHLLEPNIDGVTPLDLLIYDSTLKDPLKIESKTKAQILFLLLTTLLDMVDKEGIPNSHQNAFSYLLSYSAAASKIALLSSAKTFSKKALAFSTLIYFIAQKFTLSKLLINTFILSKAVSSIFSSLPTFYHYGSTRPIDSLKKVSVELVKSSLISYQFYKTYSFNYLKGVLGDISKLYNHSFYETNTGKEMLEEINQLSDRFYDHIEPINKFIDLNIKHRFTK